MHLLQLQLVNFAPPITCEMLSDQSNDAAFKILSGGAKKDRVAVEESSYS